MLGQPAHMIAYSRSTYDRLPPKQRQTNSARFVNSWCLLILGACVVILQCLLFVSVVLVCVGSSGRCVHCADYCECALCVYDSTTKQKQDNIKSTKAHSPHNKKSSRGSMSCVC